MNSVCVRTTRLCAGVLAALAVVAPSAAGAVHARAAISSHCSRATANALLTKLGFVSEPGLPPAAQVLCGHFTGPKSNAMAVTQAIPSCGASITWFVFQFSGGDWKMKLKRPNGAFLDAIGTRIRETHFLLRSFDAHCFPTGGTVSRIWRWNGHGFSHTAYRRSGAMFVSPTRNLWCVMAIKKVDCQSAKPSHSARLNTRGAVRTCPGTSCAEEGTEPLRVQVLPYGHALAIGAFRCSSSTKGITCVARANQRGFRISKVGTVRVT